jgi:hypothetical protein
MVEPFLPRVAMRNSIGRRGRHMINPSRHNAFAVDLDFSQIILLPGDTHVVTANITRVGIFSDTIVLSASNLPTGVTMTPVNVSGGQNTVNLMFVADPAAAPSVLTSVTVTGAGLSGGVIPVTRTLNCQIADKTNVTSISIEAITLDPAVSIATATQVPFRLPLPPDVVTIGDILAGKARLFDESAGKEVPLYIEPLMGDHGPVPHHRSKLDIGGYPTTTGNALSPLMVCGGFNSSLNQRDRKPYRLDIGVTRSVAPPANITSQPPFVWGDNGARFTTSSDGTSLELQRPVIHMPHATSSYLLCGTTLRHASASWNGTAGTTTRNMALYYHKPRQEFYLDLLASNGTTALSAHPEIEMLAYTTLTWKTTVFPAGTVVTWRPGIDKLSDLGITFTIAGATDFNDVSRSWQQQSDNGRAFFKTFALPRAGTPTEITASQEYLCRTQFTSDINFIPQHSRSVWPDPYDKPDRCFEEGVNLGINNTINGRTGGLGSTTAAYNVGHVFMERWLTSGQQFYWHYAMNACLGFDRAILDKGTVDETTPLGGVNEYFINVLQFGPGYALSGYPRWKKVLTDLTAANFWHFASRSAGLLARGGSRRPEAFIMNGFTMQTWLGIDYVSGLESPTNRISTSENVHQHFLTVWTNNTDQTTGRFPQAPQNTITGLYTTTLDMFHQTVPPSPKNFMTELCGDALWRARILATPRWEATSRSVFMTGSQSQMKLWADYLMNFHWRGSDLNGTVDLPRGSKEGLIYTTETFFGVFVSTAIAAASGGAVQYTWDSANLWWHPESKSVLLGEADAVDSQPTASNADPYSNLHGFTNAFLGHVIQHESDPVKKKKLRNFVRNLFRISTGFSTTGLTYNYNGSGPIFRTRGRDFKKSG